MKIQAGVPSTIKLHDYIQFIEFRFGLSNQVRKSRWYSTKTLYLIWLSEWKLAFMWFNLGRMLLFLQLAETSQYCLLRIIFNQNLNACMNSTIVVLLWGCQFVHVKLFLSSCSRLFCSTVNNLISLSIISLCKTCTLVCTLSTKQVFR